MISFKTKLAIFIVILFWASAFVAIRAGLQTFTPGGLALQRFIVASIIMYIVYMKYGKKQRISLIDFIFSLFAGAVGIGLYNIALNYGELVVSAGMASFIVSQSPVITTILACLFLRERMTFFGVLGMLISAFGVMLIAISNNDEFDFYLGIVFVLLATFVGSLYSIMQKSLLRKYNAIDLAAYAIWGGTLLLLIFTPNLKQDLQQFTLASAATVLYLGIFPAAVAYLAWNYVLSQIPASRAVSFLYFSPIVATVIGWIWLGEIPTVLGLTGGFIALIGVWMVNHSFSYKPISVKSVDVTI